MVHSGWAAGCSDQHAGDGLQGDLRGILPGFHNGRDIQIESQELGSASPPSARTV